MKIGANSTVQNILIRNFNLTSKIFYIKKCESRETLIIIREYPLASDRIRSPDISPLNMNISNE